MMYGGGWKGLIFVLISAHTHFCLATATTCSSPATVSTYNTNPIPIAYNNSPTTTVPGCIPGSGTLQCAGDVLLLDNDTGSAELNTSKVFAWDTEVNLVFTTSVQTKVRQVNLFFYNIPSSGIGLPPAKLFWSNTNPSNPNNDLSHVIVGNQDLSQDDRTLRNVSLVVTTDQSSIADYRFFRIHFTFPADTSLIDWILLSEVQLCGEAVALPTTNVTLITFLPPNSTEPPVPPGPDDVVSAANLSCTVANEGSFQWQWTPPPGITLSQMWVADGTRTSIVKISQISSANAGDYTCQASFNGQSEFANTSITVQLNQTLVSSPTATVTVGDPSATLSCELYGYLMRQPPTITWNFGSDVLMNDSVFTITVQDGSHMIQNGGDTPQPSMRSVLTINHPNRIHDGSYICSVNGALRTIILEELLVSSPTTTVTIGDPSVNLSCELYGYLMRQPPIITWNFGGNMLMNDSVFTITVQDGRYMIQNGGDTPRSSMRSVLTINHPNRTHEGSYMCSVNGAFGTIILEVTPLPITFLQPEPAILLEPDNVVSAVNLSCTVVNEGSFQWQWTPPPGINLSQMWVADETRTSIVQISQISAANAGDYTCQASFDNVSANTSIDVQLSQVLLSPPTVTVTLGDPSANLSCELYGYLMRQPSIITWNFGNDVLMDDSVFTITVQDGSHMIQNGGDTPQPSMRSVLTIDHPNRTYEGSYICSVRGGFNGLRVITLQVMEVALTEPHSIGLLVGLPLGALLAVTFLVTTVAVVIAVRVQLSRKKEKTPACAVEYEAVGPPQQPQGADTIITNMNVAYASTHHNATHASTSFNTT